MVSREIIQTNSIIFIMMNIKRPYSYNFFVLWGNGLNNSDRIIDFLRKENNISIDD